MRKTYRDYDKKEGLAIVIIEDKFGISIGRAKVHDDDRDLESEKTGLFIAEARAKIERERKRLVASRKRLNAARTELQQAFKHNHERAQRYALLQDELNRYLNEKEEFRKRYRKMKSKQQGVIEK